MTEKKFAKLIKWAVEQGAVEQPPTNEWEVLRLRVEGGVAVVWRNKKGEQTANSIFDELDTAFHKGEPMPRAPKKVRHRVRSLDERTIRQRDGDDCFYCFQPVLDGQATIEHLVPRAHSGPNHLSNKFLAHSLCNQKAGHLSAPQKIKMREAALIRRVQWA